MTPSEAADAVERAAATVEQEGRRLGMPGRPAVGYEHDAALLRALTKALRNGMQAWCYERMDIDPPNSGNYEHILVISLPDTEQEGEPTNAASTQGD